MSESPTTTQKTPLIDQARAIWPNAEPCHGHGPDSFVIDFGDVTVVATHEHDDVYMVGIYRDDAWHEGTDEAWYEDTTDPLSIARRIGAES